MKNLILLAALLVGAFSSSSYSCDFDSHDISQGYSTQMIEVDSQTGVSEKTYLAVIKEFNDFFGPLVDKWTYGRKELVLIRSWKSKTVNAFAENKERFWYITLYGGWARHPQMNRDGLTLSYCHELGHFLGGYPKKLRNRWSSAEGQADYFATSKCLRKIWMKEDNQKALMGIKVPDIVKKRCAVNFSGNEYYLCQRSSMAGMTVAKVFQDLEADTIAPQFETPDPSVVQSNYLSHPFHQCRLDTYFAGAVCQVPHTTDFDRYNQAKGACHPRVYPGVVGARPRCWFAPRPYKLSLVTR